MPPAFVLSQDQTLTLELQIPTAHPHRQTEEKQRSRPLEPHLNRPELTFLDNQDAHQWHSHHRLHIPSLTIHNVKEQRRRRADNQPKTFAAGRWSQSDRIYGGRRSATTRATYRKNPASCPEDKPHAASKNRRVLVAAAPSQMRHNAKRPVDSGDNGPTDASLQPHAPVLASPPQVP